MDQLSVVIIDDNQSICLMLDRYVKSLDCITYCAANGMDGIDLVQKNRIDVVITDLMMPGCDGMTVLKKVKEINPSIEVIIITAYGDISNAVSCIKDGAFDYLTKPFQMEEVEALIERVREKISVVAENRILKSRYAKTHGFNIVISESKEMKEVMSLAVRVAKSEASVLITGESGTGKELVARGIHATSSRRNMPFVVINIAALSENLIESELFGHEKGAFTDANQTRTGYFEQAHKGTLFIDEIGDIPMSLQVKLLRAIQFKNITRVGGNDMINVDTRIISATHRNLEAMIKNGNFRDDLFYRLNVVAIHIPPLRKRKLDIPALLNQFLKKYSRQNNKQVKGLTTEALDFVMRYEYPGNVRELENVIARAVILCRTEYITLDDLPCQLQTSLQDTILDPHNFETDYDRKISSFESEIICKAFQQCKGDKSEVARLLKMTERRLRSRIEKLKIKAKIDQLDYSAKDPKSH